MFQFRAALCLLERSCACLPAAEEEIEIESQLGQFAEYMDPLYDPMSESSVSLSPLDSRRLRWRARRGRLENDLIFERFFNRYAAALNEADIKALSRILTLSDDVLMDILLTRTHPEGEWATPEMMHLWARLRSV